MNTTLHALKYLGELKGALVRETQLRTDLRATVSPAPTGTEISDALNVLSRSQWAVEVRDTVTGEIRWRITEAGRGELAARGI